MEDTEFLYPPRPGVSEGKVEAFVGSSMGVTLARAEGVQVCMGTRVWRMRHDLGPWSPRKTVCGAW